MGIRYDDNMVKRPLTEYEYSLEEVQELERCSHDIKNFIKYVRIIDPDKGEVPFGPYEYQWEMLDLLDKNRHICALWNRQSGKCSCSSTLVTIRNKKTKEIENISMEDFFERNCKK